MLAAADVEFMLHDKPGLDSAVQLAAQEGAGTIPAGRPEGPEPPP